MHQDTKFMLLVVSFVLVCLGLLWAWNQPSHCKDVEYQDLTGTHTTLVCTDV